MTHMYRASLLAILVISAPIYAHPGKSIRAIEIISASQTEHSSTMPDRVDGGIRALPARTSLPARETAVFSVHDLSRRWVAFQMAQSLSKPEYGSDGNTHALDPMRSDYFAPLDQLTLAVPSVVVPLWMRGGVGEQRLGSYLHACHSARYRPTGFLRLDVEDRRQRFYGLMSDVACQHGIPVELFDAIIIRESRYRSNDYSTKRAYGLTQLMAGTAADLGVNRYDLLENLQGGARYLRKQLDRFGAWHLALAAYNAGPERVRNGRIPRIPETLDYVSDILCNWRRLAGEPCMAASSAGAPGALAPAGRSVSVSTY